MSNRSDRSLGVKPYSNAGGITPCKPKWSFKLTTAVKLLIFIVLAAAALHVLHATNPCPAEVRCAD